MDGISSLHEARLDQVCTQLCETGMSTVVDLGCGSGGLLHRLAQQKQFQRIVGLEASGLTAHQAKLNLADHADRISIKVGSYIESQPELSGFDAAALIETIEHIKPEQLGQAERSVFAVMQPKHILITTPNVEYNPLYGLAPGEYREADHKFEWSRAKFRQWSTGVAKRNGYRVRFGGIGVPDPELGPPTQTAMFRRYRRWPH